MTQTLSLDVTRSVGAPFVLQVEPRATVCANTAPARSVHDTRDGRKQLGERYVVLGLLGRGAMGMVYRAYDIPVKREVAVKVLHVRHRHAQEKLLEEARAMAKLSHPNVVTVYRIDVDGTLEDCGGDGRMLLAMQYVRGQTLQQWLAGPRTREEVLRAFHQAGLGLLAAHRVGIVHRDFKPANVMVDEEGNALVTDFGVAGHWEPGSADEGDGRLVGTPWYMPPEQYLGSSTDPRVDQYAFCVALWEALANAPLFGSSVDTDVLFARKQEPLPPWPNAAEVSPRISGAIHRGLSKNPEDRFASMAELLAALAPVKARSRWLAAVVAGSGLACVGAFAWTGLAGQAQRCSGASDEVRGVWGPPQRDDVRAALYASKLPYAAATAERVEQTLDTYAGEWIAGHRSACEATAVDGTQSARVMDLRMACLHRRKLELQAVVDVLARADAAVVERAVQVTTTLPVVSHCADVARLQAEEPAPEHPRDAAKVEQAQVLLTEASMLRKAAKYSDALEKLDEADLHIADVPHAMLRHELASERALVLHVLGRYGESEEAFERALPLALASGVAAHGAVVLADLARLVGNSQARVDEGVRLARLAVAAAEADPRRSKAHAQSAWGLVLISQGRFREAEVALRSAWELHRSTLGADHPLTLAAVTNLAAVVVEQGRYVEAEPLQREGLAAVERVLGPDHPTTAMARANLGISLHSQRKDDAAEFELRSALSILEAALGARHLRTVWARTTLARVLEVQGRAPEAEQEYLMTLRTLEQMLGSDHPSVAEACIALGNFLHEQKRYETAEAQHRRALSIYVKVEGENGPSTTHARFGLGRALVGQNRLAEAEAAFRAALSAAVAVLAPDHMDVVRGQFALGKLLAGSGRSQEARELLTAAWSHRSVSTPSAVWAQGGFELAKLLWYSKPDRSAAFEIAEQAKAGFEEAELSAEVREVEQWIAKRRHHG